jgi:preprotein translocase subunit SecE
MTKVLSFLREVKTELGKVTWPKKDDLIGSVIIVCLLSLCFAVVLGIMDSVFSVAVRWLIR